MTPQDRNSGSDGIVEISAEEGRALVERQTQKHFGLTADEFARRWRAGEITEGDDDAVARVAMLLPFLGEPNPLCARPRAASSRWLCRAQR
jgi:hypothetical protein